MRFLREDSPKIAPTICSGDIGSCKISMDKSTAKSGPHSRRRRRSAREARRWIENNSRSRSRRWRGRATVRGRRPKAEAERTVCRAQKLQNGVLKARDFARRLSDNTISAYAMAENTAHRSPNPSTPDAAARPDAARSLYHKGRLCDHVDGQKRSRDQHPAGIDPAALFGISALPKRGTIKNADAARKTRRRLRFLC